MVPWRETRHARQLTSTAAAGGEGVSDTYGEVFQVDHDGEGHPQGFAGRHHTSSQRDDALRREGRAVNGLSEEERRSRGLRHLGVDVEETVALKVPPLALGIVEQETVFDDEESGA